MAKLELTKKSLMITAKAQAAVLMELLYENDVAGAKTQSTALKLTIDTLNTAIQALSTTTHTLT